MTNEFPKNSTNELPKFPATSDQASFNWKSWFDNVRKSMKTDGPIFVPQLDTVIYPTKGDLFDLTNEDDFEEISLNHEEYRTYIYGNGVEFTVQSPKWLIIENSKPKEHTVETNEAVYEITPGWIAIKKGY